MGMITLDWSSFLPPLFLFPSLVLTSFFPLATCLPRRCPRHGMFYHFMLGSGHRPVLLYYLVYASESRSRSRHFCCTRMIYVASKLSGTVCCGVLSGAGASIQTPTVDAAHMQRSFVGLVGHTYSAQRDGHISADLWSIQCYHGTPYQH